jgi:ankyrin repeat protein
VLVLTIVLIAIAARRGAGQPTALGAWLAIERGDERELQHLLEHGLDPNAAVSAITLLMHAASQGDSGCVGVLIRMGAEVDRAADCNGATALTWAAWNGTAASVRCLLDAGADVNARMNQGWTPLTIAAMSGDEEKVTAILATGAEVHARTAAGITAAEIAANRGHTKVASLLKVAGVAAHQDVDAEHRRTRTNARLRVGHDGRERQP